MPLLKRLLDALNAYQGPEDGIWPDVVWPIAGAACIYCDTRMAGTLGHWGGVVELKGGRLAVRARTTGQWVRVPLDKNGHYDYGSLL